MLETSKQRGSAVQGPQETKTSAINKQLAIMRACVHMYTVH